MIAALWAWVSTSTVGRWVAAIGAALAALAFVAFELVRTGRSQQKAADAVAGAKQTIKAEETRNAVDRTVARNPDPAAELQRDWRRD